MEPSSIHNMSSHFDTTETLKLFIPVKRLLDSYIGSTDPPLLTKGYPSDPILSVDLDKDVIIQTAYIRRSHDEENELLTDFILEDTLPPCWSISDVSTCFTALKSPISTDMPVELLSLNLGMATKDPSEATPKESVRSNHFEHLLTTFDANPTPAVAITLLNGYSSNLRTIYTYLRQLSHPPPPIRPLSIANEDVMWNMPQRSLRMVAAESTELPLQIPPEMISHLNRVLAASQVDLLPITVFTSTVSQWLPSNEAPLEAPLVGWIAEMHHLFHLFYQQRQVMRKD
jgi:hypothetical protein